MFDKEWDPEIVDRAGRASLIESFGITGLYGYRSICLTSDYAATILIAKNGTGKTTLLGALNAFLRMQLNRLSNIEFSEIRCKIRGHDQELVLSQSDVIEYLQVPADGEIAKLSSRTRIDVPTIFNFLVEDYGPDFLTGSDYVDNPVFSSILQSVGYSTAEATKLCNKIQDELLSRQPNVAMVSSCLKRALNGYEVVYLPTYRRVELALTDDARPSTQRKRRRPKFNLAAGSLFSGDIQFGLSDIAERLAELNQKIIIESNNGYREISANIINELIDGSYQNVSDEDEEIPTENELQLFFSRLKEGRRMGPYPPVAAPQLDKLYSDDQVPETSRVFLKYFLSKLKTVINKVHAVELPVDDFIDSCNRYLLSSEPSTIIDVDSDLPAADRDGKILCLNRTNLKVHVESLPEKRKITLDSLSSGEKQMISLFAKLFLYPGRKIVLIDEPELSLSIDWQRKILTDVLGAPLCEQLIAITHSPFVFDNELEPFARALSLSRSEIKVDVQPEIEDDD